MRDPSPSPTPRGYLPSGGRVLGNAGSQTLLRAVEGRVAKSLSAGARDPRINGSNVGAISSAGQQETGNACGEM
jgi:hypothetical protein